MGLFQHKMPANNSGDTEVSDSEQHFFDEYFREELRNHGRWYFEKIISENGSAFKKDLDATVERVNSEAKEYLTKQIDIMLERIGENLTTHVTSKMDEQISQHNKAIKEAQDKALEEIHDSVTSLREQHKSFTEKLEKNVAEQEERTTSAIAQYDARMTAMKEAQDAAIESINQSTQTLKERQQEMAERLEANVTKQESMLVDAFQENMARTVEHYLLDALGDQYDLKAQLPAIIKQLEENKQAIMDDVRL